MWEAIWGSMEPVKWYRIRPAECLFFVNVVIVVIVKSTFCQCEVTIKNKIIIVKGVVIFYWVAEVIFKVKILQK